MSKNFGCENHNSYSSRFLLDQCCLATKQSLVMTKNESLIQITLSDRKGRESISANILSVITCMEIGK